MGDSSSFTRLTRGESIDDAVEKITAVAEVMSDIEGEEESNAPKSSSEAFDLLRGPGILYELARQSATRSRIKGPGDQEFRENRDSEIVNVADDKTLKPVDELDYDVDSSEVVEVGGRDFVVYEVEMEQGVVLEDESGYALWSQSEDLLDESSFEDSRLNNSSDRRFRYENNGDNVAVEGDPFNTEHLEVKMDAEHIVNEYEFSQRMQDVVDEIDGVSYEGVDNGEIARLKVSKDGRREEFKQRLEAAYVAAKHTGV